ncbi:MAG: hypothetical protein A2X56_01200 [Nitrospirae bacterium GWC2_57_13]|jgi:uncharacterized protein (TIGR03545 family)|nr:MAG: hypothetical protein A2X56_01200 [Nitrospirae bacterium GWC2_57_13]OGW45284.1 MAG: hypothetical protein A2X57_05310 [Nitrospirae bacterium GWD2_57_8]
MKKWIRWQGLISFLFVFGGITAFMLLVVDGCVERTVEKAGTWMAGAKVDLRGADVKLFPLGVTLKGLQVTDKDEPMTNAVEISRIAFSLDGLNLFRRKVIIDEMAVEGVRFGTLRKTSGAVTKEPKKKKEAAEDSPFALPSFDMPDMKKVLQEEELRSLAEIDALKADIKKAKEEWKKRTDELPDKASTEEYRKRIKEIRKDKGRGIKDIQAQLKVASDIKDDIDRDLRKIREARQAFSNDLTSLRKRVDAAEKAPMDDVRRIRDKYGISPQGLQNMTQLLFGGQISGWIGKGVYWYDRLKPVLERSKEKKDGVQVVKPARGSGVDVRFKEYQPLPNFLIKKINTSVQPETGTFTGNIRNITPDQDVLKAPMTFAFSGSNMKDVGPVTFEGVFDHVDPAGSDDRMSLRVQDYRVKGLALSRSSDLPVTLEQGLVDLTMNGAYRKNNITATLTARVSSAKMSAGTGGSSNRFTQAVSSTLMKVSDFTLTADVQGTPEDYKVRISSDLDRVLKDAAGAVVKEHTDKLEQKLKVAVFEKAGGPLKELKESFSGMGGIGDRLSSKDGQFSDVSKEAGQSGGSGRIKLPF